MNGKSEWIRPKYRQSDSARSDMPTFPFIPPIPATLIAQADVFAAGNGGGGPVAPESLAAWLLWSLLLFGVAMWLMGRKFLRLGFGLVGAACGAAAGVGIASTLALGAPTSVMAVAGAVVGLVAGLITFRLSITLICAVVLSTVTAALVFSFVAPDRARELRNSPLSAPAEPDAEGPEISAQMIDRSALEPSEQDVEKVREWLKAQNDSSNPEAQSKAIQHLADAAQLLHQSTGAARDASERFIARFRPIWNDLPRADRTAILAGALGGATMGLGIGLFFHKRAASVITAAAGALMWLPAAVILARRAGVEWRGLDWLENTSHAWLLTWAILAVIGTCIQWACFRRHADKPSESSPQ